VEQSEERGAERRAWSRAKSVEQRAKSVEHGAKSVERSHIQFTGVIQCIARRAKLSPVPQLVSRLFSDSVVDVLDFRIVIPNKQSRACFNIRPALKHHTTASLRSLSPVSRNISE